MQIANFGAVFEAALNLERRLVSRYQAQAANQPGAAASLYRELAQDGAKRLKRLERVRRETVTEMILEAINDLYLSDDLASLADVGDAAPLPPEAARDLERSASRFYAEAAEKIGLDEAARALRRLGKENAKRADRLAAL
ncbi:MAG: hypothetical protein M5R40_14740 [Anaerolineae bacterium]|nr:hypothetical protein [Anaerolineae bacterium]